MGYMLLMANCFVCKQRFTCNAELVPSYENEPICKTCIGIVNEKRAENGLPLWPIHENAYGPQEV